MHRQFKALGDKRRLEIVKVLFVKGPQIVDIIAASTGIKASAASAHLQRLMEVGLVKRQEEGRYVVYDVDIENMNVLTRSLAKLVGWDKQDSDDTDDEGVWK